MGANPIPTTIEDLEEETMFELTGKYAESCKVFASQVEESAMGQLERMINHPAFEGAKVRIMPDVHASAGSVIGFTSTMTDKIIPNRISSLP